MNRVFSTLLITALATTSMVCTASAQPIDAIKRARRIAPMSFEARVVQRVQRRETNQLRKIHHGVIDGSLTFREANQLYRDQRRVERTLARYMRDGRMRSWEARKLDRMQDRAAARIRNLRRNGVARMNLQHHIRAPHRAGAPRQQLAPRIHPTKPRRPHRQARPTRVYKTRAMLPASI